MAQREVLEEDRRGPVEQWAAHPFAPAHDIDEAALVQRLEDAADRDPANLLDLGAPDRLTVGDEPKRLQRGGAQPCWPRRELCALDRLGVLRAREDLPPAADLDQLDSVAVDVVVLTQLVERGRERGLRRVRIECRELLARNRASAGEQRRFKQLR